LAEIFQSAFLPTLNESIPDEAIENRGVIWTIELEDERRDEAVGIRLSLH